MLLKLGTICYKLTILISCIHLYKNKFCLGKVMRHIKKIHEKEKLLQENLKLNT